MDEYIKKQDIYDELSKDYDYLTNYGKGYVDATIRMVKAIPAADVVEVRHGEWIKKEDGHYVCSECGRTRPYDESTYAIENWACNYCHWCGAKMDGKDEGR